MNNHRYYHEMEQNLRNHESFLPRKFGAIRYGKTIIDVL